MIYKCLGVVNCVNIIVQDTIPIFLIRTMDCVILDYFESGKTISPKGVHETNTCEHWKRQS